ncbi:MAG: CotH kinase family protein, partial [Clostridia bacterium]|nr:CotH kinase family protein [Clostridia bacterium]
TKERGGGFFKGIDKQSYRVEFHSLSSGGKDQKTDVSMLGMTADTDWLLICNAGDETCMSNYLAWDLWKKWHEGEHTITPLDSRMVELFIQDEYMGLYQLMPRIQADAEITAMGGDLDADVSARLIGLRHSVSRPLWEGSAAMGGHLELRCAPSWMSSEKAFSLYEPYVAMSLSEGAEGYLADEEFIAMAEKYVDVRSFMSYYLYLQVCSLPLDNVHNNLYIWAIHDGEGGYTYRLSPWDMDSGFKPLFTDGTPDFNFWMELPKRMLSLNVSGCRELIWEIWKEKRSTILTDDTLYQCFLALEEEINATGAYMRESERWRGGAQPLSLGEMSAYTIEHMGVIERMLFNNWPLPGQTAQ